MSKIVEKLSLSYKEISVSEINVDENGVYREIDMDYAVTGNLSVHFKEDSFEFEMIPFVYVSCSLIFSINQILFFSEREGRSVTLIPTDEFTIEMKKGRDNAEFFILRESEIVVEKAASLQNLSEEVGKFFRYSTNCLLERNSSLVKSPQFCQMYPGGRLFAQDYLSELR